MNSDPTLSAGPAHLNPHGCVIKVSKDKGRCVYASCCIPRNTVIEISPVLLFSKEEYETHGKFTLLDHYTFNWSDGRMALALGLGSLFNHADPPNVSYRLDTSTDSIRYTTTRDIQPDEELCIFYGHRLWFSPAGASEPEACPSIPYDDGWGGLSVLDDANPQPIFNPFAQGDPNEVIQEEDLPFTRFKLPPEEEEPGSIRTTQAWVVDIPDQKHTTTLLKWLKKEGLDGPELGHLKRIRKVENKVTLLLTIASEPPTLPSDLNLHEAYLLPVPISSALTLPSLALKSALWPTIYTPRRKDEPEAWTRRKLNWAWGAMKAAVDAAQRAESKYQELPVAAHIPIPYSSANDAASNTSSEKGFIGHDTRKSLHHPLKHASINAIRKLADCHASLGSDSISKLTPDETPTATETGLRNGNGTNYLLTDMTFFITHEPCIMCSMALLHSRVKDIFYIYPMSQTGGCGGCTCLPTLKGVNHRFNIFQWKVGGGGRGSVLFLEQELVLDATVDA